jgi:hypothetical protein
MRRLTPTQRLNHANTALGHYNAVQLNSPALITPARRAMRNRVNRLVARRGRGRCR